METGKSASFKKPIVRSGPFHPEPRVAGEAMRKEEICWITSNYFIDVDSPIIPTLSKYYDIDWRIIHNKKANTDYIQGIEKLVKGTPVKCRFHRLQSRRRNVRIVKEYWNILRTIDKKKYKFYYFDIDGMPYLFPLVLLRFNRNKVIWAAHHVTVPKGTETYHVAKLYMPIILKYLKNFQVFSKNQLAAMQEKCPGKKVFFAPLALINFGDRDSRLPKDQVVFLFFGYIRDYKRVDILINAANKVYENTGKKFKVKIFGYCTDWDKYEKLIKYPEIFELKIKFIPNDEIPPLFKESHYLVLPYQDLAQSAVLTVAFNYNLPVIASDIHALREFIVDGDNGFLFESGSVESLADLMMKLIAADEKSYTQIKQNLAKYVEQNYSIESIVKSYVGFFKSTFG